MTARLLVLVTLGTVTYSLLAQTPDPSTLSPYGGVPVTPGQLTPHAPNQPEALPPGSGVCPASASMTCVVTGQYNAYRQSTNFGASLLANPAIVTKYFTNVTYFQTDADDEDLNVSPSNPILAQPLWLAGVPMAGGKTPNVLIAATLNDSIYAFDADATTLPATVYWKYSPDSGMPLYKNCPGGAVVAPPVGGPAGLLPFYGIVSTPVVDTTWTDPILYVVSACAAGVGNTVSWYLNAIDVETGLNVLAGATGGAGGIQITGSKSGVHPR